jgi:hypothetical protein
MFYLSGKNSDESNDGRPPYFEYKNCLAYLQGSSDILQTWSTCNKSCVDNNWKPIRDVCVANAGNVDFNYSFIKVGTTGSNNQIMVNCTYGGEAVFGYQSQPFAVNLSSYIESRKTLSMDNVIVYSTGVLGVYYNWPYTAFRLNSISSQKSSVFIESTGGEMITGITGMTGGFGCSVSQKGDLLAVGAYLDDYRYPSAGISTGEFGKVYIYDTGGSLINEISPPQGREPDGGSPTSGPSGARGFGYSVALLGSGAVLVGAPWTSGFRDTPTPGWTDAAGASYIYSTGGQLLHTLTGETGTLGLSEDAISRRLLGWQGVANDTSLMTAGPGLIVDFNDTENINKKSCAFYETGGAYLKTLGPKYSTAGFHPETLWAAAFWSIAANSSTCYTNDIFVHAPYFGASVRAFNNDGSYQGSIDLPTNASFYAATAMDASDKYLLLGDIDGDNWPSPGKLYIMETGDLFLKEIAAPNPTPLLFGIQVAANDDTYVGMNQSGLLSYTLSGSIPFQDFTGQVAGAFDEWKGLLESVFTGATINFVNLGLETGTSIGSNETQASYPLNSNIGDTRIGMQSGSKAAWSYCPGGTMNVSGELGGDIHMDRWAAWRQDGTPTGEAPSGAYSIYYATAQAIGGALGFGADTSSSSIMYDELKPGFTFTEKFPNGLSGSPYERNAALGIYGV